MPDSIEHHGAGHRLLLLADRAVFWPARRTLLLADTHFGKPAAFRSAGLPVPETLTATDLARLSTLVAAHAPERLVILGDFFHARAGCLPEAMDQVAAWRAAHASLAIQLVRGNHDASAGDPPPGWSIRAADGPVLDSGLAFCHEPRHVPGSYALSGHLHPGVRIGPSPAAGPRRKTAGGSLRAPCFWMTPVFGVLPAFGSFTGRAVVSPGPADRVYAVGDGEVIDVTPPAPPARGRSPGPSSSCTASSG